MSDERFHGILWFCFFLAIILSFAGNILYGQIADYKLQMACIKAGGSWDVIYTNSRSYGTTGCVIKKGV